MASGKLLLRLIVQSGAWIVFMGVLLFWPAGDWLWPEAWAFLTIFTICSILFCLWLWRSDRALLESRMGSLVQKDQSSWDKIFMASIVMLWNLWLVCMALDARRWHTSHVPVAVEVLGGLLILIGFALTVPVFRANSFAAPVVRVQEERGQRVIDNGPYALVRHPMYAGALLLIIGMPLALDSWYGVLGIFGFVPVLIWRLSDEERFLTRSLPGYAEYTSKVRWRLIPGLF